MPSRSPASPCAIPAVSPEDGAKLPYGLRADGTLAHISEVPSGLDCICVCPGCRGPLVARKGLERAHHFAHHVDRDCAGAWETTLHLLSKEVIAGSRSITLPEVFNGGGAASSGKAVDFKYDSVEVEVGMGSIKPDLVIRGRSRELAVEVAVTHRAEEAKLNELRRRGLAAIEIDLSRAPRHAPRAEHAELILRSAPRRWLHNAKVEAAEQRRREVAYGRTAAEVAAVWHVPPVQGHPSLRQMVEDAGLGSLVGSELPGAPCFSMDTASWQSAFVKFAAIQLAGSTLTADEQLRHLQQQGCLKEPFSIRRAWDPDLVAHLRAVIPGFVSPIEAIVAYAEALVGRGILERLPGGRWRADYARGRQWWEMADRVREARGRVSKLREKAGELMNALPRGDDFDVAAWLKRPRQGGAPSPAQVAAAGGLEFDDFMRKLTALATMVRMQGSPIQDDLLGLPLERVRDDRAIQERRRQRALEAERAERAQAAEEQRRRDSASFLDGMVKDARTLLGAEAGSAWVEENVVMVAGSGVTAARHALDGNMRRTLGQALAERQETVRRARAQEQAKLERERTVAALAARCQGERKRRGRDTVG